ncbi:tyrosine-protein kinase family protein [Chondromyces apiculatus]|uniref:Putative ATP/GTP-binding protein n=1 Tax=Chondromyces apiculatus DSM 436 TaxID=1192034 RepID=A0A017SUF7_9BACT|nr:AAA family ATPase [Chondromyces apiculatus]EYF00603.1 Putative ATP/GTP-binding protein [Chondromyces apiculatus DSM 436]
MLRVTFYSYKGGVGRTLALLNVAAVLARRGRKVVAVDLDLEAPGFGLSLLTRSPEGHAQRGVSEFLLERRAGENMHLQADAYAYPILPLQCGDNLWLMPAGQRAKELADLIPGLYDDPEDPSTRLFDLLVAEIAETLAPDYLFFDSRTGTADIAGVCTLELPQVVVAVCGLGEQNVEGMADVLQQMRHVRHENEMPEVATLVALSPVPQFQQDLASRGAGAGPRQFSWPRGLPGPGTGREGLSSEELLLLGRMEEIERRVMVPIYQEFGPGLESFPNLHHQDLLHELAYEPLVPLTGELQIARGSRLAGQYRALAQSIARASTIDASMVPMDEAWMDVMGKRP